MSICKWFKKKKKKKETLKYDGLQNVVIEDKSFEGGDVQLFLTNCDGITIKGCDFTGVNSENGHAILIHNSRNIEIVDCTFSNMVVGNSEVVALHA